MIRNFAKFTLIALLCGAPLAASSVREVPFDVLSRAAKRVIAGEIIEVVSERDPNGYIYTNVTMLVSNAAPRSLEGHPYTFRTIGGEVDGQRLFIQGMPRFEPGQQVALFLHDTPGTALGPTVGLWQGVFFVEREKTSGSQVMLDANRRTVLGLEGAKLMLGQQPVQTTEGRGLTFGQGLRAMAVDAFFEKVRAYRSTNDF